MTKEQVAKMGKRADSAGQLGLAILLMALADALNEDDPLGLPRINFDPEAIRRGHDLAGGDKA